MTGFAYCRSCFFLFNFFLLEKDYASNLFLVSSCKIQNPIAKLGRRIRKDKNPSGSPKWIFASSTNPINHADTVAVIAVMYTDSFSLARTETSSEKQKLKILE